MVDGADETGWSQVAQGWAELWGSLATPARVAIIRAAGIGPGVSVLDAGCGSGEFLRLLVDHGARAVGADPAEEMVGIARNVGVEVVRADIENLPFAEGSFDVATAVNALQFAEDTTAALKELARVVRPGGLIAISNWAEESLNDLNAIEAAVAAAREEESLPDGPLRPAGGIEAAFASAGLDVVESGTVEAPWSAPDVETLTRGVLLGEDAETMAGLQSVVARAAAPYRDGHGGFVLRNHFRWSLARVN